MRPFSRVRFSWLRRGCFCGTLMYNTVLRYGCARLRSVGLFALPYFKDLVKAVLSVFYSAPYTDYTYKKKSPQKAKYTVKQCRQNAPDMVRRNSPQKWQDAPQGYSVDLPCRKSAKYFFGAVDMLCRGRGVSNLFVYIGEKNQEKFLRNFKY